MSVFQISLEILILDVCRNSPSAQAAVMAELPSTNTVWKSIKPFVNGGASGMLATCVIQPIDMVKVRIQLGAQGSPVGCPSFLQQLFPC